MSNGSNLKQKGALSNASYKIALILLLVNMRKEKRGRLTPLKNGIMLPPANFIACKNPKWFSSEKYRQNLYLPTNPKS